MRMTYANLITFSIACEHSRHTNAPGLVTNLYSMAVGFRALPDEECQGNWMSKSGWGGALIATQIPGT